MSQNVNSLAWNGRSWTRVETWTFIAFGFGYLLESYIFGLGSIATSWYHIPSTFLKSLLLAWAPIWLIIGIIVSGPLSDRLGRKNTFTITMTLYGLGGVGIYFSNTYVLVLVFLSMLLFAAGGEMNTIMVATHEMMPREHRGKASMLQLNFINVGGIVLALVSILAAHAYNQNVGFQRGMISITALVVLVVLIFSRARIPESIRWLMKKGRQAEAEAQVQRYYGYDLATWLELRAPKKRATPTTPIKRVGLGLRFYASTSAAFGNTAGFGLMTYVLGPRFFSSDTAAILLVADGVQLLAGFFGLMADRVSRRWMFFASTTLTFFVTVVVWILEGAWSKNLTFFFILLVILNLFNSVAYLTEDTVKGEIWPTDRRGTYTAVVRFISIGVYAGTIFVTEHFSLRGTVLFNAVVWFVAALGTFVWLLKGVESGAGASVEEASQEA